MLLKLKISGFTISCTNMYKILFLVILIITSSCKKDNLKHNIEIAAKTEITIQDTVREGIKFKIDTVFFRGFRNKNLITFYSRYNYETVWHNSKTRKSILKLLQSAEKEGLNPYDYQIGKLINLEEKLHDLDVDGIIKYDLLITYNLQKYIQHITIGKMKPKKLYNDWELKTKTIDINKILIEAYENNNYKETIEQYEPNHDIYKRLKKALGIVNSFPKDNLNKISIKEKIIPNDTNINIINIKKRLIFWHDLEQQDDLTKIYDTQTKKAIKRFQLRHGLAVDGVIGKSTVAALNFNKKDRIHQIITNLERWRWYPNDFGNHYILINIPDYKLIVVNNNDTVRSHKVIVGTTKRKTPILTSKLSYFVFNPTWTVPPTILREDIIPATLKNRSYLTEKNITIYDASGNIVNPYNWQLSKAKSYRYVQSPGTFNSMGMVKIIFPNRFSVYLHDTNHREYFSKRNRSISSGCVRVENPLELTEHLLDDSEKWNLERITDSLIDGKTKKINIKQKVNLHILYWTAWIEDSNLIFRDDIYNLDADLFKKLRN
jgi:L,D-transpeptidase YcbB